MAKFDLVVAAKTVGAGSIKRLGNSMQGVTGRVKNLTQSRFKEMIKMVEEKQLEDVDVAKEVLMGWEEMENEDGTDVEFNKANLNKALDVMGFATAVGFAFMESSKVRFEKN